MPQFDPAVWPGQLFWLAVIFIVLYLLMSRIALPRIGEVLDEREKIIGDNLRRAEHLRHDAEEAMAAYDRAMAEAFANAGATVQSVREQALAEAATQNTALSEKLNAEIESAEARIGAARDAAVASLSDMAADVSSSVIERLIGEKIDMPTIMATVGRVLGEKR